jgi:hypothetical protein
MSNRRKLPGEKLRKPRCKGCGGREFLEKRGGYNVRICQRCERIEPINQEAPDA